jgi:hypothetical protein
MLRGLPVFALITGLVAGPAAAAPIDSLYSNESVELRADERLFALFVVLNGLGWSEATDYGPAPLTLAKFDPMRADLRDKLTKYRDRYLPSRLLNRLDDFVSRNPASIDDYVAFTLLLGDAPGFQTPAKLPANLSALRGLAPLLAEVWKEGRLAVLMGRYTEKYMGRMRRYLAALDGQTKDLMALVKGVAVAAQKKPKKENEEDLDDLFGDDDEGGGAAGDSAEVALDFEGVSVHFAPFWRRGASLHRQLGGRFHLVYGGGDLAAAQAAYFVALVRIRGGAGTRGKVVSRQEAAAARALMAAIGVTVQGPLPKACARAGAELLHQHRALTAEGAVDDLLGACASKD